ncbi:MAG TPA: radical SAM protein [Chitinophagaceae bacterium]|nr:radical SAM protein [Chitinophagaceae bacterium]
MNKITNYILKSNLISKLSLNLYSKFNHVKVNFTDFRYSEAVNPTLSEKEVVEYNKNRKFKVSKEICFAPKSSMIFSFDGNVYLCCENKSYPIGNILQTSLHEIWFGQKRKWLDNEINNNYNLSNGCSSCERKIKHQEYTLALAQTFDLYNHSEKSSYPSRLDFEIHNTCNLECVMCGGIYSSSIQANRNKMPAIKILYDENFVQQLDEFIPYVKYINLIGGEPTLIKVYYDIMEKVNEHNPKCVIHLQTNASTLNAKFKNILDRGNFQIGISVDALIKEKVETIRKNIVFEEFMEHVNFYIALYKKNKIKLTINTCPMPENWSDVLDVIDFCNQHKLPIFFCIVNAPYYSSFESSSIEFINEIVLSYDNHLKRLSKRNYFEINNYNRLRDLIQQIRGYIPIIKQNDELKSQYINESFEDLLQVYKERLFKYMEYADKEYLINLVLDFFNQKIKSLNEKQKKDVLLIMIVSVRESFYVSNAEENLKWSKEFINTLIFSYLRNDLAK